MLELNYWFFVLVANFLVLLFILNKLLFQPLLKIFQEREEAISGALDTAQKITAKRERATGQMRMALVGAQRRARESFAGLRSEGLKSRREQLESAATKAAGELDSARQELKAEGDRARKALRADVDRFASEIVDKLIKP